jgi:acyl-CoA thioester hydrolase
MTDISRITGALDNLTGGVVHPWHIDQFGHMNVRWYAPVFDDASFLFWNCLGLDVGAMTERHGVYTVTAQATTQFRQELTTGTCYHVSAEVIKIGTKSVTLAFRLTSEGGRVEHAVYETVEVFVDAGTHRSTTIPADVLARLETTLVDRG